MEPSYLFLSEMKISDEYFLSKLVKSETVGYLEKIYFCHSALNGPIMIPF